MAVVRALKNRFLLKSLYGSSVKSLSDFAYLPEHPPVKGSCVHLFITKGSLEDLEMC